MDSAQEYGQQQFNLPHDVVKLPSKGIFYTPKKESLKVGYLTASDENILMSSNNTKDGLIKTLLRNKIYEPGFNIGQMINVDVQAVLIFLRNTAFGSEYNFSVIDPVTKTQFDTTILLDEINYLSAKHQPDDEGLFSYELPKSKKKVKLKLLTMEEETEVDRTIEQYPKGMVAPVITKKLEKQIVELDGNRDKGIIATFINQMPILDSKSLRTFLKECEPQLDLDRKVLAPSGEEVTISVSFGVEFFRPFFQL
jgi:hypothetical protein